MKKRIHIDAVTFIDTVPRAIADAFFVAAACKSDDERQGIVDALFIGKIPELHMLVIGVSVEGAVFIESIEDDYIAVATAVDRLAAHVGLRVSFDMDAAASVFVELVRFRGAPATMKHDKPLTARWSDVEN